MNFRKILIIGITFLFTVLLALGAYNLFFLRGQGDFAQQTLNQNNKKVQPSSVPPVNKDESFLPQPVLDQERKNGNQIESGVPRLTTLSEGQALGLALGPDSGAVRYYDKSTGFAFEASPDGTNRTQLSSVSIPGLQKVIWSPDRSKVVTIRQEGDSRKTVVYNYLERRGAELDKRIQEITWSPQGDSIFYHFVDPAGADSLAVAKWDGRDWQVLSPTDFSNLKLFWPLPDLVYIQTPGVEGAGGFLYQYSLSSPQQGFRVVLKKASKLEVDFSPSGRWLVVRRENFEGGSDISLRNLSTGQVQPLNLPIHPQKCAWSLDEQRIYCAVRASEVFAAGIYPEELRGVISQSMDTFWQIDLANAQVRELFAPPANKLIDVTQIEVSVNEDYLVFINKLDGKAYSLRL